MNKMTSKEQLERCLSGLKSDITSDVKVQSTQYVVSTENEKVIISIFINNKKVYEQSGNNGVTEEDLCQAAIQVMLGFGLLSLVDSKSNLSGHVYLISEDENSSQYKD